MLVSLKTFWKQLKWSAYFLDSPLSERRCLYRACVTTSSNCQAAWIRQPIDKWRLRHSRNQTIQATCVQNSGTSRLLGLFNLLALFPTGASTRAWCIRFNGLHLAATFVELLHICGTFLLVGSFDSGSKNKDIILQQATCHKRERGVRNSTQWFRSETSCFWSAASAPAVLSDRPYSPIVACWTSQGRSNCRPPAKPEYGIKYGHRSETEGERTARVVHRRWWQLWGCM